MRVDRLLSRPRSARVAHLHDHCKEHQTISPVPCATQPGNDDDDDEDADDNAWGALIVANPPENAACTGFAGWLYSCPLDADGSPDCDDQPPTYAQLTAMCMEAQAPAAGTAGLTRCYSAWGQAKAEYAESASLQQTWSGLADADSRRGAVG